MSDDAQPPSCKPSADALLSPDARAIVRELRRGNEAAERIAAVLDGISSSLATIAWHAENGGAK